MLGPLKADILPDALLIAFTGFSRSEDIERSLESGIDEHWVKPMDALGFWQKTPTCAAVRLTRRGAIDVIAPYGLDDLFALHSRPTPAGPRIPRRAAWP